MHQLLGLAGGVGGRVSLCFGVSGGASVCAQCGGSFTMSAEPGRCDIRQHTDAPPDLDSVTTGVYSLAMRGGQRNRRAWYVADTEKGLERSLIARLNHSGAVKRICPEWTDLNWLCRGLELCRVGE